MSEEPLFDPSLKKRKKKQVAFSEDPLGADADPTAPAPTIIDNVTTNGDTVDMGPTTMHEQLAQNASQDDDELKNDEDSMFSDLKKKKKKKAIPMDLAEEGSGASTPVGAPADAEDLDFSDLKKKKKKTSKKKAALDMKAFEDELNEAKTKNGEGEDVDGAPIDEVDEAELGDDPFARANEQVAAVDAGGEAWLGSDRDYTYAELLRRFYAQLHVSNPALLNTAGKRHTLAPPQLMREGNKKTVFANIADICKRMHRQPEHTIQFMFAELGTTGSIDGSGRLVIRGKFSQAQIENVLRRYIVEYVTCKTCKSPDTLLVKENRIFFVACESCGSRRSVNAIKTGFQAQVGRRSKNKTG